MNVLKQDLLKISAIQVERYMAFRGWRRNTKYSNKKLMFFYREDNDNDFIVLPQNEKYHDFPDKLYSFLQVLSDIEERPVEEILCDMNGIYRDKLEFRIISKMSSKGTLPLEYAAHCIDGIKDLILYSACAEQDKRPICKKPYKVAKEALDRFEMGQTSVGSYILHVEAPVVEDTMDQEIINCDLPTPPIEHKVVKRISEAIQQVSEVVDQKKQLTELTENAYETGITANMCEAFMNFMPTNEDIELETTIRYAGVLEGGLNKSEKLTMKSVHFATINEISKIYHNSIVVEDVKLDGFIRKLYTKGEETEFATLETEIDTRNKQIQIAVNPEYHDLVCEAYRMKRKISVSGELDKSGKIWFIDNPGSIE